MSDLLTPYAFCIAVEMAGNHWSEDDTLKYGTELKTRIQELAAELKSLEKHSQLAMPISKQAANIYNRSRLQYEALSNLQCRVTSKFSKSGSYVKFERNFMTVVQYSSQLVVLGYLAGKK